MGTAAVDWGIRGSFDRAYYPVVVVKGMNVELDACLPLGFSGSQVRDEDDFAMSSLVPQTQVSHLVKTFSETLSLPEDSLQEFFQGLLPANASQMLKPEPEYDDSFVSVDSASMEVEYQEVRSD